MSDNLDEWLNSGGTHIDDARKETATKKEDAKKAPTYSPAESAIRGAGSGLLMGFQPQVAGAMTAMNPFTDQTYAQSRDESAAKNEQAWQENPVSYGAGYTGGMLGTGALGAGLKGAAAGIEASRGMSGLQKALGALDYGAGAALRNVRGASVPKVGQGPRPTIQTGISHHVRTNIPTTIARVTGGAQNRPEEAPLIPPRLNLLDSEAMPGYTAPMATPPTQDFSSLQNFLKQSEEANLAQRRLQMQHKTVPKDQQ